MRINYFKSGILKVVNLSFDLVLIYLNCEIWGICKVIFICWYFFGMRNGYFKENTVFCE